MRTNHGVPRCAATAALLFCAFAFPARAIEPGQGGRVEEAAVMPSAILGRDLQYTIYFPPDYDSSSRTYPVFYLLHGAGDDDSGWLHLGEIKYIMDKGIAEGRFTPMIVVTPDGRRNPENFPAAFYTNDADGGMLWEDMFLEEFVPYIEKTHRVRKNRKVRAIGGLSMGGYGALMYSLKNPDMFSATVALSAAVLTGEQTVDLPDEFYSFWFAKPLGEGLQGRDRINEAFRRSNPLHLAETASPEDLNKLALFIDCGSEDELDFDVGNAALHILLRKKNVPHTYLMRSGTHNWTYWRAGVDMGMKFATAAFHE